MTMFNTFSSVFSSSSNTLILRDSVRSFDAVAVANLGLKFFQVGKFVTASGCKAIVLNVGLLGNIVIYQPREGSETLMYTTSPRFQKVSGLIEPKEMTEAIYSYMLRLIIKYKQSSAAVAS